MMSSPAGGQNRGRTNDGTQKAKNVKYTLIRLWDYLYFYKRKLILALFLSVIANVLSLIGPFLTGRAVSSMEGVVNFRLVFFYAALMIVFYVISSFLNYLLAKAMVKISQSVVYKMRKDLFGKLSRVHIKYYDRQQTGDIISRMSYDIDTINTSLATDVLSVITSLITLVISLIMMIIMSPLLVLVFVVTIPISFTLTRILSKLIKKKYRIRNQKLGELNGFSEEMISGQRTIQSYVLEAPILEKYQTINKDATKASYEAGYYSTSVMPTVNFISNLSVALVGVFGGLMYFYNSITLGNLTSFTLYSRRFSGPINQISTIIADIQSALAAAERVFSVIDYEDEVDDIKEPASFDDVLGKVRFKDVSFSYIEGQEILKNVSFEVNKGQVVAVVGPTGSGKTTLINLLMRFYDVDSGKIEIDGHDIRNVKRSELRKAFSMVLQDTWIFHGSVYENIAYGNGNVTKLEVEEAAKQARIHGFISSLPFGYDTLLTDEGLSISKGQKQLVVIARAILSKTKMLILDEATSNVDTHTEVQIQKAMLALMKNKTSFVIAHRLSTIINADVILVIHEGKLIEQGTHKSLLEKKGFYHDLYYSQFA
jgi:ATP-binding cassette, subfamily B, multidrug efflux pump